MNRKATLLLLSITLGVVQPISGLVMGHQPTAVTAQAAAVKADNLTGTYGDVAWYLTPSGELHLGAGTLPEANLTNVSVGQFARVIAAAEGNSAPTTDEAQAVADQVTKVVFDGPVKAPKNATGLFSQLRNVTDYVNLDKLNTSDTTTMSRMFYDTTWKSVTTTIDVSHFDTSKVTDMSFMFQGQGQVTALDVQNFDTSSLVNATSAFWGTKSIKELNFANGTFANFKSSSYMLTNSGVEKVSLPKFAPAANFSGYYMFYGTSTIRQITFGPQTAFIDKANTGLDDAPTDSDDYTGKW
ncbi:BspA family leucine-rich repeat surface protein [Levilactobacillus yonginensis]